MWLNRGRNLEEKGDVCFFATENDLDNKIERLKGNKVSFYHCNWCSERYKEKERSQF